MKYIAIFDIPDDYCIGCAVAKIAPKAHDGYCDADFENAYAQIEPLSQEKTEVFERFNTITRMLHDMGLSCAYDMPGFWTNGQKDYKVIPTKYHKGYMQALDDIERETRRRFGFSERKNIVLSPFSELMVEGAEHETD